MKLLPFSELCETYFDLHSITVVSHFRRQGDRFSTPKGGRPDNGIMLLTNCAFDYIDGGRVTDSAHRTQLVYMPIGSCYSCRSSPSPDLSPSEPSDYLINFRIFDEDGCELRLADDRLTLDMDSPRIAETFVRIVSLSSIASPPLARIKALLYELLYELSIELARHDVMMNRRCAAISPAIERIRSAKLSRPVRTCVALSHQHILLSQTLRRVLRRTSA